MDYALESSDFVLTASGGEPPYRWRLASGSLPEGLSLHEDGRITGTPLATAKIGDYAITVEVTDAAGATARKQLKLHLAERSNRWYETARLVALIHVPEANPSGEFDRFAKLMKRQGYGLGMVISYNNGRHQHRWPNPFCPDCPLGDCMTPYKKALEAEGIRFGMYFGNFNGDNHGGIDGALLLVEDALKKFQPKAIWFDWLGHDGQSLDSLFSMIKTRSPDTLIVLNGIQRMNNGDWDVICLEGWSAWGDEMWKLWPFHFQWPKRPVIESWRLVSDPAFEYSKGRASGLERVSPRAIVAYRTGIRSQYRPQFHDPFRLPGGRPAASEDVGRFAGLEMPRTNGGVGRSGRYSATL